MTKALFKTITEQLNFSLRNKTPVILQAEASECGIACLAMVAGFYGLNIDLFNFRQRFGSPSQGTTLLSLSHTAERAGLKNRALSLDLDEIRQLKLPCILHWGMNHFVVLTQVKKIEFRCSRSHAGQMRHWHAGDVQLFHRRGPRTVARSLFPARKSENAITLAGFDEKYCWSQKHLT